MDAHRKDDPVSREIRRFDLARRLILHEVRTDTISQLTSLSRHRLAALRQRLMVSENARHRGPAPRSLEVLLRTSRGRTEGAALVALFPLFKNPTSNKRSTSLDEGELACDIYDAYLAYYPQATVQFEELMLLKRSLAKGNLIELGQCRVCRALIINIRIDGCGHTCAHCECLREPERAAETFIENTKDLA